ncbi:male sterility protein [Stylonychia lemnae]|uniref:Male sterility protein n=1 Tax=Stylonychia lemnae TaxID=5949 RepID=A0A078B0M1_STYLE|nr:male sterility protein [Stylonychia lemnae]|eukprot:CDW87851.1 male sterility protein [Stylonychia lemnae]
MIKEFYKDKVILITGTTGFLGKVVLEKFFRSLSDFKRIYLLVRPKKGTKPMDRINREILQSQCFDNVRGLPQFDSIVKNKIVPIEGDITKENLAINPKDREILINDLDIVINCAASVDFNERLCDAIQINYFGCLRMYQLAEECKNLKVFCHVSTCYVNSEKKGFIKEQIYDINEDSEELINRILRMTPQQQDEQLAQILGPWPNTYTFTKSMGERTLKKMRRPDIPVVLLRPSIIGASLQEPMQGWTDTFSAAGGLTLAGSLGIVNYIRGDGDYISDLVPVDYVSNCIIVATAIQAQTKKPDLLVVHSATSHNNPITWHQYMNECFKYLTMQPFQQQVFKPYIKFVANKKLYNALFFLRNDLPVRVLNKIAMIPGIGGPQMQKNAQKLQKINMRALSLGSMFEHFTNNEWIYESNQIYNLQAQMSQDEIKEFQFDAKTIDWPLYVKIYVYGMQKFILKEEVICPTQEKAPIIPKNNFTYFEDIKFAFLNGQTISHSDPNRLRYDTLNSNYVQDYIYSALNNDKGASGKPLDLVPKTYDSYMKQAAGYLGEMQAVIRPSAVRPMLWLLSKIWQRIYDQIIVNESGLNNLKQLLQKKDQGVILVPTHKSFIDFLLVAYIHYHYQMDLPFTCGEEQLFKIALIKFFLRSGGGFFQNEKLKNDKLFAAVMSGYIQALMGQNCAIQIFLEKKRSRSGKIQRPNEDLFDQILENYFIKNKSKDNLKDLKFVPITINYDIVYDGEQFPMELLGESKVEESFIRVLKQFSNLNKNIGKVVVKYCEPVSLEEYTARYLQSNKITKDTLIKSEEQMKHFITNFGQKLCQNQTDNLVIMITSLTASILLMHRKGISYDQLLQKSEWLFQEVQARNAELSFNSSPSSTMISTSLGYLGKFIDQKRNVFEPSVSAKKDYKNIVMLSYYRNNLTHLFINDSEIACCIFGFGSILDLSKNEIKVDELEQKYKYLQDLLSEEFVIRKTNKTKDNFLKNLEFMESRRLFTYDKTNQTLKMQLQDSKQQYGHSFLCHMLLPYIESYWLTFIYFISLDNRQAQIEENSLYNKIQWLAEALYDQGHVKFYESCMLESMRNAVKRYTQMGVLTQRTIIKKRQETYTYSLSEKYQDEANIEEFYEELVFYLPYPSSVNLPKIQNEIRKIMMSDIQLLPKL